MSVDCEHLSASGIDQTDGEDKVWRCDGCGWLFRYVHVEGQPSMVRVMRGVRPAAAEGEHTEP